jgi:hypothetical protein
MIRVKFSPDKDTYLKTIIGELSGGHFNLIAYHAFSVSV